MNDTRKTKGRSHRRQTKNTQKTKVTTHRRQKGEHAKQKRKKPEQTDKKYTQKTKG